MVCVKEDETHFPCLHGEEGYRDLDEGEEQVGSFTVLEKLCVHYRDLRGDPEVEI